MGFKNISFLEFKFEFWCEKTTKKFEFWCEKTTKKARERKKFHLARERNFGCRDHSDAA
jgi:hypothetical protein